MTRRTPNESEILADLVELAPGTGIWTEALVSRARRVTAVDASAEMLDANRRRRADGRVRGAGVAEGGGGCARGEAVT